MPLHISFRGLLMDQKPSTLFKHPIDGWLSSGPRLHPELFVQKQMPKSTNVRPYEFNEHPFWKTLEYGLPPRKDSLSSRSGA